MSKIECKNCGYFVIHADESGMMERCYCPDFKPMGTYPSDRPDPEKVNIFHDCPHFVKPSLKTLRFSTKFLLCGLVYAVICMLIEFLTNVY